MAANKSTFLILIIVSYAGNDRNIESILISKITSRETINIVMVG